MKIALISDIHANIHALQAVWMDLEQEAPDQVYCLGDLVGYGVFPNEVIEFIRSKEIPSIMGNYDEGVGFDMDECGCAYPDEEMDRLGNLSLLWSRQQTTEESKKYLQGLQTQIRIEEHSPHLMLVHASPRRINEYLYEDRPEPTFDRIARLAGTDILAFGHTHLPYQKKISGTLFVNAGSVGKPKGGDPRAAYAILSLSAKSVIEFKRVEYDVAAAAAAIRGSDMPDIFAKLLETGDMVPVH
jgi:putative phosphoesterase